jgi:hypothetical protein
MTHLLFYTTSHCHLCEQAEALMRTLQENHTLNWQTLEITDNDDLMSQYGTRIPVIQNIDNKAELAWPFNQEAILNFITKK